MVVPEDIIGAKQAAELLGLDRSTVIRRAKRGALPSLAQVDGSVWVFDRTEIQAAAL